MADIIQINDVSKQFATGQFLSKVARKDKPDFIRAVDHVSFNIEEGETFGLAGPNGAGKTTLIKLMCTLLHPTSGQISVCGHDTRADEFQVRREVGLVTSNERSFYWRLSGHQNLKFFASLYGLPRRKAESWIDDLLSFLDLTDYADERFDGYSTGIKQRFALARGLLSKPQVLLMDEPTKGVDPIGAAEIIKLVRDRLKELWRPTVLITSHNLREIELLCQRIAIMHHGALVALGTTHELRQFVQPVEIYRLRMGNTSTAQINALQDLEPVQALTLYQQSDGVSEFEVKILRDSCGLHAVVASILRQGGQLLSASSLEQPLDEVFVTLIENLRAEQHAKAAQ